MEKFILLTSFIFLLSCGGNKKETVVIYSPHSGPLLESVADRFEEETGITVEYVETGTDAVVERIKAERASPKADIMYGGSATYMEMLKKEGLLEKSTPTWKENIDPAFIDEDGYWYGPMQTPAVLFYNTNNVRENDIPKDWLDITNSKYKGKLQWLRAGGTANVFLAVMVYHFDKLGRINDAWEFLTKFDDNVMKYYSDGGIMYNDINSPIGYISMFVLPYIADGIYNYYYPWNVVNTKSGIINIIDAVAVIKNSPNQENAKTFVEWVGSKENMVILANDFNRMPTDKEAISESPEWMKDFNMASMPIDWSYVSENMGEWVKYYEDNIRSK